MALEVGPVQAGLSRGSPRVEGDLQQRSGTHHGPSTWELSGHGVAREVLGLCGVTRRPVAGTLAGTPAVAWVALRG